MDWRDLYTIAGSERVKDLEKELGKDLTDLKNEIEENEMVHGIASHSVSTVPLPKDVEHFRKERQLLISRSMQVSESQPVVLQSDVMREEMQNAEKWEYTTDSIPLLLHQYFVDRIHQLVQCKHMHMLRWKRFCEHTNTIESLYPHYQKRLAHIMFEYNDCRERAQRLSLVRECIHTKSEAALQAVQQEDLEIYLRWLVCHLHSTKRIHQYLRILQWLHVSQKAAFQDDKDSEEEETSNLEKIASRYQNDSLLSIMPTKSAHSTLTLPSAIERKSSRLPPATQPTNITLLSTSPLPASAAEYASASTGGGLAGDEKTLKLPLHMNELNQLRPLLSFLLNSYNISTPIPIEKVSRSSEEMEIFALVSKRFKLMFTQQEVMKMFKTYDRPELGNESWGSDSAIHALKQTSNWLPYVSLHPEHDPNQQRRMTHLRQAGKVDELLRVQASFIHVTDPERIQDGLREHAQLVRDPPSPAYSSIGPGGRTHHSSNQIWKRIYTCHQEDADDKDSDDMSPRSDGDKSPCRKPRASSARKQTESYNYLNTMQLLGLDDGDQNMRRSGGLHGGYLSYLLLRHLRIRDLQRTSLSVLNYFRSVERTLTINDRGLSLEGGDIKASSPNHRRHAEVDGVVGGGGGLKSHAYIHNTPLDFKVSETAFMEFSDVKNHDDFYAWEEGRVHVQDQRGYFIIYDSALDDLKSLEKDLLLVASHFIEKDRDLRFVSGIQRSSTSRQHRERHTAGDFDVSSYAHQEVDRFAVLMDLWTNETAFLECKKELLDCYLEAYHNVFDRDEKRALARVITNIMYRQPRYDFDDHYFIQAYRAECIALRMQTAIVKKILDAQIESQREYIQRVCREGDSEFGLPHKIIPKQLISINMSSTDEEQVSRPALKNVYMLEFHPSLALASRIPEAFKQLYWELYHTHKPASVHESILLECRMLEVALAEWNQMDDAGASFSPQLQKELFSDVFVEDPLFICEIGHSLVAQQEEKSGRRTQKERQMGMVQAVCRVLESITLRHRLLDCAWETEILSKVYRLQSVEMGFDEYHMFLRCVQFEFANFKDGAGKPPPIFITTVQEDDSSVDRYVPVNLSLAIHDVDSHMARFSFRSREALMQLLQSHGIENLQVVLKCQIVHKNALLSAVQQAYLSQPAPGEVLQEKKSGRVSPSDSKSEKSSLTQVTGFSSGTQGTVALNSKMHADSASGRFKVSEAFVSLQLEKGPVRDVMLNEFVNKKQAIGSVLRNPEEMEKVKRQLISMFCHKYQRRMSQYSLRGQLIMLYKSILRLLNDFPNIRETYFLLGEPNEKKAAEDSLDGLIDDPRQLKKRPRRLISADGQHVLNMWFIPHYSEIVVMLKTLSDEACVKILSQCVRIVSSIHNMLRYLCAHAKLGSGHARMGSQRMAFMSADWGGSEGIGADLREIQRQVDNLSRPTDPASVADFLTQRSDVMFLEFEVAVRHCMTDTFLSTGNIHAYKAITSNIYTALPALSNVLRPSVFQTYLTVPEPWEASDLISQQLCPWRSFLGRNGPYPLMFYPWQQIDYNIQLCLAGLKDVDRHVANGEILGVILLMEDVLSDGSKFNQSTADNVSISRSSSQMSVRSDVSTSTAGTGVPSEKGSTSANKKTDGQSKVLSRTQQPLESCKLLKTFLLLWKRLELLKIDWGQRKLAVEKINRPTMYKEYCALYKVDKLFPVLQNIARALGQADLYQGLVSDVEPLVMPYGASEIDMKAKQLFKLLESLECHMIDEVRKRVSHELALVLAERAREEGALPTDLWKKPGIKESYTIARPHIAESFATKLMSDCASETDTQVTFQRDHLNACLLELAQTVMAREKHNYESYSMYYENLLRIHHQLLYQKEQELKQVRDQLQASVSSVAVDVQCQMADQAYDLLMEVSALRAKIAEMREQSLTQERDIRDRVRDEYENLIQNLFSASFQLKTKFDDFRGDLHDDVFEKISETRSEALQAMDRLKSKYSTQTGDELKISNHKEHAYLRNLQQDNHTLSKLILKMKAMNTWRQNYTTTNLLKTITDLRKEADESRKQCMDTKIGAEEEGILLQQQLTTVREALAALESECNDVKKKLEKEFDEKQEQSHMALQKVRSQRHLEQAKQANVEKLMEEVGEKEEQYNHLQGEHDRMVRLQQHTEDKSKKEINIVRRRLQHEKSLKLDAFQRLDELQAQVYDYESLSIQRSHSATTLNTLNTARTQHSRAQSATQRRGTTLSTQSSAMWPPHGIFPANRSLTPDPGANHAAGGEHKKIQRPKTTSGRLIRSNITAQLLAEIEPSPYETLVRLREMQQNNLNETNT